MATGPPARALGPEVTALHLASRPAAAGVSTLPQLIDLAPLGQQVGQPVRSEPLTGVRGARRTASAS
jgi:hypothetical protein